MGLYVQLEDKKGEPLWHAVASYAAVGFDQTEPSSLQFQRSFEAGCGLKAEARADRLLESENPPWTHRHVAKGCFETAEDPQD